MSYLDYLKFFKRGEPEEITKLKNLKNEIFNIRKRLDELDNLKEEWFSRKERLKKKASRFVRRLKELQNNRGETERGIKEFLQQRDKLNTEVKDLINKVKEVSARKYEAFKKFGIKYDPVYLKDQIKKLDSSIETEAYTFKKEKQVMDQIKELRKKLGEASKVSEIAEEESILSLKIQEARKKADEAHQNYKKGIGESKNFMGEFTELVKKVNDVKKMQKEALDEFLKQKDEFTQQNSLLKEKLTELNSLESEIHSKKLAIEQSQKTKDDRILEEKAKQVEEKLRTRKKLTTEDILAYQGKR